MKTLPFSLLILLIGILPNTASSLSCGGLFSQEIDWVNIHPLPMTDYLADLDVYINIGRDVNHRMRADLVEDLNGVRTTIDGVIPWPRGLTVDLTAVNNPANIISGSPSYRHADRRLRIPATYIPQKGYNPPDQNQASRAVRHHEIWHAVLEPLVEETKLGLAVAELKVVAEAARSAEQKIAEEYWAAHASNDIVKVAELTPQYAHALIAAQNLVNARLDSPVTFLAQAGLEFLADVGAFLSTGNLFAIVRFDGKTEFGLDSISYFMRHQPQLPSVAPWGRFEREYQIGDNGLPIFSNHIQNWVNIYGFHPTTHYEIAKHFLVSEILWLEKYNKDPKKCLERIVRAVLAELDMRATHEKLGYFNLTTTEANERMIQAIKREFQIN